MPQQFLDGPDVVPLLQEVGGERVAEGVAGCMFDDPCLAGGDLDGPLDDGFVGVMPALHPRLGVDPPVFLGERNCQPHSAGALGYLRASA